MNGENLSSSVLPPVYGPMGFGQILDRTFKLVRAYWRLYARVALLSALALAIMLVLIAGVVLLVLGPQFRGVQTPPNLTAIVLLGFSAIALEIGFVLLSALYMPAAHYAAIQTNRGQMTTAVQAYDVARHRFGSFLWLLVLITLYLVVPLLAVVLAFTLAGVGMHFLLGSQAATLGVLVPAIFGLIYLGFLVYTVFIALRFSLSFAACVDEEIPASAALKRSAQLTQGAKWRIFVVLLVIYAILYAVTYVALILFALVVGGVGVLAALLMHVEQGTPVFFALIALGGLVYAGMIAVVSIANYIGMIAAIAVLYDDQKLRLRATAGGEVAPA